MPYVVHNNTNNIVNQQKFPREGYGGNLCSSWQLWLNSKYLQDNSCQIAGIAWNLEKNWHPPQIYNNNNLSRKGGRFLQTQNWI